MHSVLAVIPVKPLEEGKSRLASVLNAEERNRFNAFLMSRTFERASYYPGVSRTIVVSRSESVIAVARASGMIVLLEHTDDLNGALASGTREAMARGATGVFVLPVDLPMASSEAVRRIVERSEGEEDCCVLVPDRGGRGTNLMYLSPPRDDLYRFGSDSFRHHLDAAAKARLLVLQVKDEALAFDIDEPSDYEQWRAMDPRGFDAAK